ncbi:hypothetical protein BY996DRAFT_6425456 [Phakopsora pachyrhizi]|nr:hypothetical protein BY996DRAFT_6425456 [Phakopsora pachyrhizi]
MKICRSGLSLVSILFFSLILTVEITSSTDQSNDNIKLQRRYPSDSHTSNNDNDNPNNNPQKPLTEAGNVHGGGKKMNCSGTPNNCHPSSSALIQNRTDARKPTPFSQPCQEYYSANTDHAVCRGDRSIMCHSGCTGAVVCTTSEGAFTCAGPFEGQAICNNCLPTNDNEENDGDHSSANQ